MLGLAPEADIWCLPQEGLLVQFPHGLIAFPGQVALSCAQALTQGPLSPDDLFRELMAHNKPGVVMSGLDELRDHGVLAMRDHGVLAMRDPLPAFADFDAQKAGLDAPITPVFVALRKLDRAETPAEKQWAPVDIAIDRLTVGPLFTGRENDPCCECIAARTNTHDDLGHLLAHRPDATQIQQHRVPQPEIAQQQLFVQQALRRLPELPPGTILVRWADGTTEPAKALPRGGCSTCYVPPVLCFEKGDAVLRDGGYRPRDAGNLLSRLEQVVDPITGIVRSLTRPDLPKDGHAHVMVARHAFPLGSPDIQSVMRNRKGRSAGKGQTADEARAGAIAEAMERFAGVSRGADPVRIAHVDELKGPVILPNDWALYDDSQFREACAWRALDQPAAWVPNAPDPDERRSWTPVADLTTGEQGWAPSALCWHQYPTELQRKAQWQADSNGCAAGQARVDAQLQGLLELVERDAVGIWWWNRIRRPQVDPETFHNPWITQTCDLLRGQGYIPGLQDLTHDLGIPVVAAVAWPASGRGPLLLGFGAHPSAGLAAARALSEVVQALPARMAQDIGGDPRIGFGVVPGERLDTFTAEDDLGFLIPQTTAKAEITPTPPAPDTAAAALSTVTATLASNGLRIWTLDQSRPDVPLPVVRMIVPGLRHFRPRFAPGRLDDVPHALGWRPGTGRNRLFIRQ
ncbi:MAG: YcaO-like family protein [Sulfitobacter sp.]